MVNTTAIPETLKELVVPIDSLRPYADNPRNGDTEAIKASLEEHGQYRPIVVRKGTNEILAGNHTYAAALELGWKEIAVTYVDVTDDQARRIVIVDNRTSDQAWWDKGFLAALLQDLQQTDKGLRGTGYADKQVDDLIAQLEIPLVTEPEPFKGGFAETPEEQAAREAKLEETTGGKPNVVPLRQVIIALEHEKYTEFMGWLKELQKFYKTEGIMATVYAAVKNEWSSQQSKKVA